MKTVYGKGQKFARIGKLLFQRSITIDDMTANELGSGLGYDSKEPSPTTSAKKKATKAYQNSLEAYKEEQQQMEEDFEKIKNLNAERRLEWYLQRMLERLANKKKEVLNDQDVLGRSNDVDGKLSNNVRHVLGRRRDT